MKIFISNVKDHEDRGPWRSYDLEAEGETLDELLDSAVYWQTDQDGLSMGSVPADDNLAESLITAKWVQAQPNVEALIAASPQLYATLHHIQMALDQHGGISPTKAYSLARMAEAVLKRARGE